MNRSGVTLVELVVTMAIIAILAGIALPRYRDAQARAYVATMQADLNQVRLAQEAFRGSSEGTYATSVEELGDRYRPSPGVTVAIEEADANGWSATASHEGTERICTYATEDQALRCDVGGAGKDEPEPAK